MISPEGAGPLLRVADLKVHFPVTRGVILTRASGAIRAVDGVSFDIERGETLGVVGESGSGKSTVGRAILGIDRPTGGSIRLDNVDITRLSGRQRKPFAKRMQMIFQDSYASLDPRMSIADIVAEPIAIHGEGTRAERRARTVELLDLVGLGGRFAGAYPHQLSGGQRQRVGIARALALRPDFIICDESVSALDVSIQAQILNLLLDLQQRFRLTYLFIGHDIAVIRYIARRILVMYCGQVMELGDSDAIVAEPLHPYTRMLMASVPQPDPASERRRRAAEANRVATMSAGATTATPTGCPFAPRCPALADIKTRKNIDCHTRRPPLAQVASGRAVACHLYDGTAT